MGRRRKLPTVEEAAIIDEDFFLKGYELTTDEKEALVGMIGSAPFRIFEKYLGRKQNIKAHKMVKTDDTGKMKELQAQIRCLGEITADMQMIWKEIKRKTENKQIVNLANFLDAAVHEGGDEEVFQSQEDGLLPMP